MKVINLWAGPGAGKSTTAAGLFHLLKVNDHKAELVTEYAKDLVYERRDMSDQLMILAQQNKRLRRLQGHVDWVITDSPIPLGLAYTKAPFTEPWFTDCVRAVYDQYDNYSFVLRRTKLYQPYGRNQTEDEARALDIKVIELARSVSRRPLCHVVADAGAPQEIYDYITHGDLDQTLARYAGGR